MASPLRAETKHGKQHTSSLFAGSGITASTRASVHLHQLPFVEVAGSLCKRSSSMEADAKYGKLNFVLVSFCLIFFRSEEARTSMANDRITMFSLKGTMHDQQACITSRLLYLPTNQVI